MHRVRQQRVLLQFLERGHRVVVVHLIANSFNCRSGTGDGASHIRSVPRAVLGNGITSRIVVSPARIMTMRSSPSAMPPCGGAPYSRASRRKPNRDRKSVV